MTKPGTNQSASDASPESLNERLAGESPARRDGRVTADEQIRTRAYELYRKRGDESGDELGDWLRAEREYRERS